MTDTQTDIGLSDEQIELLRSLPLKYNLPRDARWQRTDGFDSGDAAALTSRDLAEIVRASDDSEIGLVATSVGYTFAATIDRIRSEEREVREAAGPLEKVSVSFADGWYAVDLVGCDTQLRLPENPGHGSIAHFVTEVAAALTTKEKDDE